MSTDLDQNFVEDDVDEEEVLEDSSAKFKCPNCGELPQDDVMFLCNTCDSSELIHKDGIYMCPSCLVPGENFECVLCGSKLVTMLE
jgi:predicted RNA-binding Zn-ribbon protein involved in translation (DUF1610 family)